MSYILTKSKYVMGINCYKSLWLEIKDPGKGESPSMGQKRLMEQGILVGEYARRIFPEGLLIDIDWADIESSLQITLNNLESFKHLFEGLFIYDEILIKFDILEKNENGSWNLIEVKSSTKSKDEHLPDLAIQKYVLENNGLNITSCKLMLVNRECTYPVLTDLMITEDVTEAVNALMDNVTERVSELKEYLKMDSEPERIIGDHCDKPNECKFKNYCWEPYGKKTIYIIPRLSSKNKAELSTRNIIQIENIPADIKLSEKQKEMVEIIRSNTPVIDRTSINSELSNLNHPLYFLDFEALNPALPRFNGMHPYDNISFQYSCFILDRDNNLIHKEFLVTDTNDPRRAFIENLIKDLGTEGNIVVYNKSYETARLNEHKAWYPEYAEQIDSIISRIWDQLDIFKNYYQHPGFYGSNSLKEVLPVVVPELSYSDLEVKKGDDAAAMWELMIKETDQTEKNRMINSLKEYCKLDTLAMVEIHKKLIILISENQN